MSDPQESEESDGDGPPAGAVSTGEGAAAAAVDESLTDDSGGDGALADEQVGRTRRLDGRVRYQWMVGSTVGAVFGALLTVVVFEVAGPRFGVARDGQLPLGVARLSLLVGGLAFALFLVLAVARAVLLYRSWRYEVREDSLYLTRGVLTRVQTVAPYVRVQHIDTRRSPFERLLGLSSLVVYTAGSRGADVTIPGLTNERAAELQTSLKRLAIESEEEDAV